jgi:hypothetical protein
MGLRGEVMSDEGIRYTAGTPVEGNIMFYWCVSRAIIDRKQISGAADQDSGPMLGRKIAETDPASAIRKADLKDLTI